MRPALRPILMLSIAAAFTAAALTSCKREERGFRVQPPDAQTVDPVTTTDLHPGELSPLTTQPVTQPSTQASAATQPVTTAMLPNLYLAAAQTSHHVANPYEDNSYAVSEGKRLYNGFNCVGCHAHGGGGMGPPLMDDTWIYGSAPDQVYATIIQGRPNGMPSFAGKIPEYQVWEIAAYVRSLSGLISKDAAGGRSDHMSGKTPENSMPSTQPKNVTPPPQ